MKLNISITHVTENEDNFVFKNFCKIFKHKIRIIYVAAKRFYIINKIVKIFFIHENSETLTIFIQFLNY